MKLRVFDKGDKKMKYAEIEYFDDMIGFRFEHRHFEEDDNSDIIPLLYIGVKDKNGKEIYIGDKVVLYRIIGDVRTKYFEGKVTDHSYAGITIDTDNDYMEFGLKNYEYEVIGNIYEDV